MDIPFPDMRVPVGVIEFASGVIIATVALAIAKRVLFQQGGSAFFRSHRGNDAAKRQAIYHLERRYLAWS